MASPRDPFQWVLGLWAARTWARLGNCRLGADKALGHKRTGVGNAAAIAQRCGGCPRRWAWVHPETHFNGFWGCGRLAPGRVWEIAGRVLTRRSRVNAPAWETPRQTHNASVIAHAGGHGLAQRPILMGSGAVGGSSSGVFGELEAGCWHGLRASTCGGGRRRGNRTMPG